LGAWYPDNTLIRVDLLTRLSREGTNLAWIDGGAESRAERGAREGIRRASTSSTGSLFS